METEEQEKVENDTLIDKATQAAVRLEAANKEMLELLDRQEKIKAHAIIAGETEAGTPVKEVTPEEKSIQSAREMLKGTGYDEMLFPVEK